MLDLPAATERLVLRRIQMDDVPALHAILSNPEAMRYWSTVPHETVAVTEEWVAGTMARVAHGEADDLAIVLNGAVIGKVGLWTGNEIGVIVSPDRWSRGYATEAMRAAIARAFERGIDRIIADIDPENAASRRLFEKLGFRITGSAKATFRLGEVWTDSLYLALTPEDWSTRSADRGHGCG
jgi:ribosomal-protein-alanine N-acetyltransferase